MPVAKTEVRNRALRSLGVIGWGETPDSVIQADMDQAYTEVYKRLEDANLTTWAEDADVPDNIVPNVVLLCALARMNDHRVNPNRKQELTALAGLNGEKAFANIRAVIRTPYQSTTEVEYY